MAKNSSAKPSPDSGDTDAALPPLPPQPLLAVPASRLPHRAPRAAAQLVPGLAAPSLPAQIARRQASAARTGIERFLSSGLKLRSDLTAAIKAADTSSAAAEWQREGVNLSVVESFNEALDVLLKQFTA
jgi:hypothetical protein